MGATTMGGLEPGTVFHETYEVGRRLSGGGMGAVYECTHLRTRKRRALKVMLPQIVAHPGMRERFELEARVTAEIESDHIVETFDAGVDDATGLPFLVMELLRGEDLDSYVRERGVLSVEETVTYLAQAALALDKTHAAGIVHRDLKPQNLFLTTRDDGTPRLKLLDFGIAKVVAESERVTQHTATLGTPVYMSPEQIEGHGIGPATDLYALAHVAYALLVGQAYWEEENQASHSHWGTWKEIMAGVREPASVRAARHGAALPVAFDAWFLRATARATAERHDSANSLVTELALALAVAPPRLSIAASGARTAPLPARTPAGLGTDPGAASPAASGPATVVLPRDGGTTPVGATRPSIPDAPVSRALTSPALPPAGTTTSPVSDDVPAALPVKSIAPVLAVAVIGVGAVAAALFMLLRAPVGLSTVTSTTGGPPSVTATSAQLVIAPPSSDPIVSPATTAAPVSASASAHAPDASRASPRSLVVPTRAAPTVKTARTASPALAPPPTQRGIE